MSTRYKNGSHYENHQRAAELHDQAAHAHRAAAEQHGKQDHQTGHEKSREALEHSRQAYLRAHELHQNDAHDPNVSDPLQEEIAALAYKLWVERGRPEGSAEEDWFRAAEQLRSSK